MHLCEIEALAVGQDGSGPSPVAEGQLPGAASNSQSRPGADDQRVAARRSGADWRPTFEFGLANDSSCLKIL